MVSIPLFNIGEHEVNNVLYNKRISKNDSAFCLEATYFFWAQYAKRNALSKVKERYIEAKINYDLFLKYLTTAKDRHEANKCNISNCLEYMLYYFKNIDNNKSELDSICVPCSSEHPSGATIDCFNCTPDVFQAYLNFRNSSDELLKIYNCRPEYFFSEIKVDHSYQYFDDFDISSYLNEWLCQITQRDNPDKVYSDKYSLNCYDKIEKRGIRTQFFPLLNNPQINPYRILKEIKPDKHIEENRIYICIDLGVNGFSLKKAQQELISIILKKKMFYFLSDKKLSKIQKSNKSISSKHYSETNDQYLINNFRGDSITYRLIGLWLWDFIYINKASTYKAIDAFPNWLDKKELTITFESEFLEKAIKQTKRYIKFFL